MKFDKKDLFEMNRCYTIAPVNIDNKNGFAFSSDGENAKGIAFLGDNFEERETLWENAGGCMSIKQIPDKQNEFLAIHEFYLKKSPSISKIIWLKKTNDVWMKKDLIHFPFIHRMDIVEIDSTKFVIFATISHFKKNKEDWQLPGAVYAFELPDDYSEDFYINPSLVFEGLYKNHGYFNNGRGQLYFSGVQGVVELNLTDSRIENWQTSMIYNEPTSDLLLYDLDKDGKEELVKIDDFHGNTARILKKNGQNEYEEQFSYSNGAEIIHGLSVIEINETPTLIISARKGTAELIIIQYRKGEYIKEVVDSGLGPINVAAANFNDEIYIGAANHTTNKATVYKLAKD
ncbi:hypothetical protein C7H83_10540 [Tetragenococcus halophilus]|uniref:VCBS repeat-containing protein n=1 Tax=Tetragenococcus halophilus TaxID=51669 RepID=A0A3G5FKJ0_TETHA|nr:hypothetical protein [Tetragenococcus halophilus]AYW50873.1 hypothetical protein C7H83_10540 [Tetragenococcus halophilus]GBD63745.1 hypothetical protein TEHD23766T_1172 [Tetragenococcus halophilus subsp. flandriensis]